VDVDHVEEVWGRAARSPSMPPTCDSPSTVSVMAPNSNTTAKADEVLARDIGREQRRADRHPADAAIGENVAAAGFGSPEEIRADAKTMEK
jgi:hypothetical protein